eukprot:CAMPEP_0184862608 /NCGR_PEP_ID=MMETSP0580-20130426/7057_1 /TAXON_ID=1118495 /ORGANISM="Dactyliosolen fragilissimus" /LENGTH=133 /DNA_ID=CAMNT_0027360557 /DNA_START=1074 /DNA_END=1475 /DNA_ORIENTATION=+
MKYNEKIWKRIESKLHNGKIISEKCPNEKKSCELGSGKPATFRAGLLNLFMGKGTLVDKVGIAMVTKISGDVHTVFKKCDESGDGFIDYTEFRHLVESLGSKVNENEVIKAIEELDENNDGKVNMRPLWYHNI